MSWVSWLCVCVCVFIDLAMERVLNIIQEEICHEDHVPYAGMSGGKI